MMMMEKIEKMEKDRNCWRCRIKERLSTVANRKRECVINE